MNKFSTNQDLIYDELVYFPERSKRAGT